MLRVLALSLLLTAVLGAPQFEDDHHILDEADGEDTPAAVAWSEEATTKRLNLEDPASWSASTEVLDENHAWYRRRRAVESTADAAEDVAKNDMDVAESVVFLPAHMRHAKKKAHDECKRRHREFTTWKRETANLHAPVRNACNNYCCYPVLAH